MHYKVTSIHQLTEIAQQLLKDFGDKRIIAFYGEMGVGKTTIIKEICKYLGVEEVTNSPTFSVVNEYLNKQGNTIYHFDFYRIKSEEEAYDLGYEDYFYTGNYCFIEWPEKIVNLLPSDCLKVHISVKDDIRLISVAE